MQTVQIFHSGQNTPKSSQPHVVQDVPQTPECVKPPLFCQVLISWVCQG